MQISIVAADYPILNSPFIYNISNYFISNGFKPVFINKISPFEPPKQFNKIKSFFSGIKFLVKTYRVILYDIYFINRIIKYRNELRENQLRNPIAVEKFGLLLLFLLKKKPSIYISLETNYIFDSESFTEFILNIFERVYLLYYETPIICTSNSRLQVLSMNGRICFKKKLIIPVCATHVNLNKNYNFIRDNYEISNDKKIVLIAGTMGHSMVDEIIKQISLWPKDFILFLHSPTNSYSDYIIQASLTSKSIILSRENLSIEESELKIYNSADISIIMYPSNSINYKLTAYSSGKLAAATKAGLPVLVPDYNEFVDLLQNYEIGLSCKLVEIPEKLKIIKTNYSRYATEALRAYHDIYRFSNYFHKLDIFTNEIFSKNDNC